jgi:hypothetical protein
VGRAVICVGKGRLALAKDREKYAHTLEAQLHLVRGRGRAGEG